MKKGVQKSILLWAILIIGGVALIQLYQQQNLDFIQDFNYVRFTEAVKSNEVKSVDFHVAENSTVGEITGEIKPQFKEKYKALKFKIEGDVTAESRLFVEKHGLTPNYVKLKESFFTSVLIGWLPFIFIILLFFFFFRQLQSGGGKIMSFGKSRARMVHRDHNKVTFKDVAGVDEAKDDLVEMVEFLKDPHKFSKLGGRIPKGVLMIGPPGTGKTLMAKAMAGEANAPFFSISGSDFVEMFVGVGASRVRDLFEQGKKSAPCVIFIDEIDAVGRHRGAGMGGGHDEREQTLNQLLVEMDGFEFNSGVMILAATNRADVLDPALLRPGRFDRRIIIPLPDLTGREAILNIYLNKITKTRLSEDIDASVIAKGTIGFSGADLSNLVNEGALRAARLNKKKIYMDDFEAARDKILMGSERKSMKVSLKDKEITAYHEAGHAIVGYVLPDMDAIHKISIIPRGMALGVTQTLPKEEALNLTKSKALNSLAFLFGGRVAEELIFEDFTTGASNDIEKATHLARRIVCEWGMSDKIGPVALEKRDHPVFVGLHPESVKEYSEKKATEIDEEVKRLILDARKKALEILTEKKELLIDVSKVLMEFETIDGKDFQKIMEGQSVEEVMDALRKKKEAIAKDLSKDIEKENKKDVVKKDSAEAKEESVGKPDPVVV